MIFELLHTPYPEGYGDALLPLAECKQHLRVTGNDEDELIAILRDASIEFVERYCAVKLGPNAGIQWKANGFPAATLPVLLAVSPVTAITAIEWQDTAGVAVIGVPEDYRVTVSGELRPAVGSLWPVGVGGSVVVTFDAGYPAGEAPRTLLAAARLFLGHLWMNREAVIDSGTRGEVPFGVRQLCAPFRPVYI